MRIGNGHGRAGEQSAREFYGKHLAFVRESLNCSTECAAAWCDRQLQEILASEDLDVTLESWDISAAEELAARAN